jgi:hypothetical protein
MRRKTASFDHHHPHSATRIAWWVSFLVTLALVFALGLAKSAQALTLPAGAGPVVAVVLPDAEEETEEGDEAGSEEGWEFEECELGEDEEVETCEEGEGEEGTPPECLLSSAEATVSASPAHDTVRLAVRYTARTSAAVKIDFELRGRRGALSLGADQKRFSRAGVFRQTERLSEAQMAKVVAAKSFTVELQAVNTPRYCHRYFDRSLTVRRSNGGALTWSAPAARSGA